MTQPSIESFRRRFDPNKPSSLKEASRDLLVIALSRGINRGDVILHEAALKSSGEERWYVILYLPKDDAEKALLNDVAAYERAQIQARFGAYAAKLGPQTHQP